MWFGRKLANLFGKYGEWEYIGYSIVPSYGKVKEDLKDVPKWVQKIAFNKIITYGTYYIKERTFLYNNSCIARRRTGEIGLSFLQKIKEK